MRIGIFSDYYKPQVNGVVAVIDILENNFKKLGHEVVIFAPKPFRYKETKPNVIRFPAIQGLFYDDYLTSIFFPAVELKKIKRQKLDIVLVLTPSQVGLLGIAAAKKFNLPLVTQYSTDVYEYVRLYPEAMPGVLALTGIASVSLKGGGKALANVASDLRNRRKTNIKFSQSLVKNCVTMLHNNCDVVIALSRKKQKQLKAWKTQSRIELLPTGVDALKPTAALPKLRHKLGIPEDAKVILYIGRIAAEKNLDLLIDCFDRINDAMPNTYLLMVGDYEYRPVLEEKASHKRHAAKIIFTGSIPRHQLGDYYAIGDVFAFPSITDTQGLVVHEAAMAGLPLVLVDREVSELLIPGQTGLFARNNPRSLADTILEVLSLPKADYQAMSQAVRARAEQFSELEQTRKMMQIFKETIATKAPKRRRWHLGWLFDSNQVKLQR